MNMLFAFEEPTTTSIKKRDLFEDHARELLNVPETYTTLKWEMMPDHSPFTHCKITLCLRPDNYTAGPKEGTPKWSTRDKTKDRQVIISMKEHDAWLLSWEAKTGLCHECQGSGKRYVRWSAATGTEYKPCDRCSAMGKRIVYKEATP